MRMTAAGLLAFLSLSACTGEPGELANPAPATAPEPTAPPPVDDASKDPLPPPALEPEPVPPVPPPADTLALLELDALDIWAQPLPPEARLTVTRGGSTVATSGFPMAALPLTIGSYHVTLTAPEHVTLELDLRYDGTTNPDALATTLPAGPRPGLSMSRSLRAVRAGGPLVPVYTLFLGLRHKWFSAEARPARRGNQIKLLMDGEEAWKSVYGDLTRAKDSIMVTSWWWESTFELVRDWATHATLTTAERQANTILGVLEASPAKKRVLIGEFLSQDGLARYINTDAALRAHGSRTGDNFEYMGQANLTSGVFDFTIDAFHFADRVRRSVPGGAMLAFDPDQPIRSTVPSRTVDLTAWPITVATDAASYHQKFMVIDQTAYVGGMNIKATDWDSSQHLVFDERREHFDAAYSARALVEDKDRTPDEGPRKDYMVRISGPAVQDVADVFKRRWDNELAEHATFSENATSFSVDRSMVPLAGGSQVQITTTLPEPFWEHGIAESWLNAVAQAERYIYIEDQYFRIPMLTDAIVARMLARPALRLVVITKPVSEWTDPGCAWTHITHGQLKTLFPGRYLMLQHRAFDSVVTWGWDSTESRFADIDTHAKMLIVDDKFLSVGSANKNNRGIVYEGEMNIAVVDPVWVTAARRHILANMLPAGTAVSDDAVTWWTQMRNAALANDAVWTAWDDEGGDIHVPSGQSIPARYIPHGTLYSLDFRGLSECLIENIGPDMV